MYEGQPNPIRRVFIYFFFLVNGVLGVSAILGIRLPWIFSSSGNLVTVICLLLFATLFGIEKPATRLQRITFTAVIAYYLLLLLIFPYTFQISSDALSFRGYRGPVFALCFGVLVFGYHVLFGSQAPLFLLMIGAAIAFLFQEWWFFPNRPISNDLVLVMIVSTFLGGLFAWLLEE